MNSKMKEIIGWITVSIAFAMICFWTYFGINEAFHEGWYFTSLWENVSLTITQYLSVPIVLMAVSILAINLRRIGSLIFIALGIFAFFFFKTNAGRILIFIPILLLALGFYFGNFSNKKLITSAIIFVPLIIILSFGIPQLYRVQNRINDNDFGSRTIEGNNVSLIWAPQGLGFPLTGTNWQTAIDRCARLNEEGSDLSDSKVFIWRLPSREEIVRSMTKKNNNAGGFIDNTGIAKYRVKPDKETPLWNPNSQVIYYWTNESKNEKNAYLVAINGYILDREKTSAADYQGYRCVKKISDNR